MEPVSLIMTALAAGGAAAFQDGVKDVIKDGYRRLQDAVKHRLVGQPNGQLALEQHEAEPETWDKVLTAELVKSGAADDTALIETAQALLKLVDEAGTRSGKYEVTIHGGQGIQLGDHNTQTNTFHNP